MFRATSLPKNAAVRIIPRLSVLSAKRSYPVKVLGRYERPSHVGSASKNDLFVACAVHDSTSVKFRTFGCFSAIASSFMKGILRSRIPTLQKSYFSHRSSGVFRGILNDPGDKQTSSHVAKSPDQENSTLVGNPADFRSFPEHAYGNFRLLRTTPGLAYYDRTRYISVIDSMGPVLLFLRPRRFGKSLTLSMLAHFHGLQHKKNYSKLFKDLAVHRDVQAGKVIPGQYFVLSFDFACFTRSFDVEVAEQGLNTLINESIKRFYITYASYLGSLTGEAMIEKYIYENFSAQSLAACVRVVEARLQAANRDGDDELAGVKGIYLMVDEYDSYSNMYLDPENHRPWNILVKSKGALQRSFWAGVKSSIGDEQIRKCFITGVTPLSMADYTSGFNISKNVSEHPALSGLCGLSKEDVLASLRLPGVCGSDAEIQECFHTMEDHFNGYRFSPYDDIPRVFNTNTCLEYLEALLNGLDAPLNPSNSEPSDQLLEVLESSPIVIDSFERACCNSSSNHDSWRTPIPYKKLESSFGVDTLLGTKNNAATWLSFMRYVGGLTYADQMPKKQLQVPNLVAIKRFASAVLNRYRLRENDITDSLRKVESTGDVSELWGHYQRMMVQRDVGDNDLQNKTEENHRDSFHCVLLQNPLLETMAELEVRKSPISSGRIDLIITAPATLRSSITEIKSFRINFLKVKAAKQPPGPKRSPEYLKAMTLNNISNAKELLNIKFDDNDKFRAGLTIGKWIEEKDGPRDQLKKYWASPEIVSHRKKYNTVPYLVVIVGSRKILIWEMNDDGELGIPMLVGG